MSKNLKSQGNIIYSMKNMYMPMRKKLIKFADNKLLNAFSECSCNVLKGNVPLSENQYKKLREYKKDLRTLAEKGIGINTKKKVLQIGGF